MKKILLIALIVSAIVGVAPLTGNAWPVGNSGSIAKQAITYQVNVYPSSDFSTIQSKLFVVFLDGTGMEVAARQVYNPRQTTYIFQEMGPVTGYRGATIVPDNRLKTQWFFINNTFRFDTYTGGNSYIFNLYPSLK